jgi:hypothetical protein
VVLTGTYDSWLLVRLGRQLDRTQQLGHVLGPAGLVPHPEGQQRAADRGALLLWCADDAQTAVSCRKRSQSRLVWKVPVAVLTVCVNATAVVVFTIMPHTP